MSIDAAVLAHLERLAALDDPDATDAERTLRTDELARIVAHVETLEHALVDDARAEPAEPDAEQVLRPDLPRPGLTREAALRSAAHADETTFMVPRIVP